MICRKRKHDCF